jgi:hypothetical protein
VPGEAVGSLRGPLEIALVRTSTGVAIDVVVIGNVDRGAATSA